MASVRYANSVPPVIVGGCSNCGGTVYLKRKLKRGIGSGLSGGGPSGGARSGGYRTRKGAKKNKFVQLALRIMRDRGISYKEALQKASKQWNR